MNRASKIQGAPTRQALHKLSKKEDKPKFFIFESGKYKIDVDCIEWRNYLQSNNSVKIIENKIKKGIYSSKDKTKNKELDLKDKLTGNDLDEYLKKEIDHNRQRGGGGDAVAPSPDIGSSTTLGDDKEHEKNLDDFYATQKRIYGMSVREAEILEQIAKTEKAQEEVLLKKYQRRAVEKKYIDVEMGQYIFISFIEELRTELSLVANKQSPNLESYYKSNQPLLAEQLLKKEFSNILSRIKEAQDKALKKWKRKNEKN